MSRATPVLGLRTPMTSMENWAYKGLSMQDFLPKPKPRAQGHVPTS